MKNAKHTKQNRLELVLEDLAKWIEHGDSDCSMQYAYRHGFYLHAASLWMNSGAMSDGVPHVKIPRKLELIEIKELCKQAFIYVCPDCNHHAFLDYDEGTSVQCSSCLKTAIKEGAE
jgi:hypothetical protein